MSSLYWLILLVIGLLMPAALGSLTMGVYAVGLGFGVVVAVFGVPRLADKRPNVWVLDHAELTRRALAVAMIGLSGLMLSAALL
jgi:hypothetical protein